MDHTTDHDLDRFLERGSASVLRSLDAAIDVDERLRKVLRDVSVDDDEGLPKNED